MPHRRNVHLHLVDISAGWHICKSLTVAEFTEYRQTQVYSEKNVPLQDIPALWAAAGDTLELLSAGEVKADDPFAMNGFMLFASYIEAQLSEEVEPSQYVKSDGDWFLAIVSPRPDLTGPILLLMDYLERHGEVPLTGEALDIAVVSMLHRALPQDGFDVEDLDVDARWAASPADPAQLV